MLKSLLKAICIILGAMALISLSVAMVVDAQHAIQMQADEGKCIMKLVVQGIERKDIATDNGTCYIK